MPAEVSKFAYDPPRETLKQFDRFASKECTLSLKPFRVGEVVQADHGLDSPLLKAMQHLSIPL
jgi:hypothetical protein